jgi:hypothetical protein
MTASATAMVRTAAPEIVAFLDLMRALVLGCDEFHRDPDQKQRANHLQEGNSQDVGDDDGKQNPERDGGSGAEQDADAALLRRQRSAGERDDDRVVARQQDVDPDDLEKRNTPLGDRGIHGSQGLRIVVG